MEAEREGLHVGMSIDQARRLCPSLHVCPPNPRHVATADYSLLGVIQRYAPAWEPFQPGSVMMDLTGTTRLFGSACDVAAKVQQDVLAQYQLEGVAGVGSNKLVAQTAATLVEPSQLYDVRQGSERLFMSPLSVRTLPGVHRPCMRPVLKHLEISTCARWEMWRTVHWMPSKWSWAIMPVNCLDGRKASTPRQFSLQSCIRAWRN
jgi:DNA polymerase-4